MFLLDEIDRTIRDHKIFMNKKIQNKSLNKFAPLSEFRIDVKLRICSRSDNS